MSGLVARGSLFLQISLHRAFGRRIWCCPSAIPRCNDMTVGVKKVGPEGAVGLRDREGEATPREPFDDRVGHVVARFAVGHEREGTGTR